MKKKILENKIVLKISIYILGIFIFSFGITIVINTKVGVSPSDILILSIDNALKIKNYSLLLTIYNVFIFILAIQFYLIKILKKKHKYSNYDVLYFASQLVPTFLIGPIIFLYQKSFINSWDLEGFKYFIKIVIFIGGWVLFCVGGALMVWVNIMQQSGNSIVLDITKIFNIKFVYARVIYDFVNASIGITIILATSINQIWTLVNLGTIVLVFITGIFIHFILIVLRKIYNIEKKEVIVNE